MSWFEPIRNAAKTALMVEQIKAIFVDTTTPLDIQGTVDVDNFPSSVDVNLNDSLGNPLKSFNGALNVHPADVHSTVLNRFFYNDDISAASTTPSSAITAGDYIINVTSGSGLTDGEQIMLSEGNTVEPTFPVIISGGGTTTLTLDRPLNFSFTTGAVVKWVTTNLSDAVGTMANPVSFKVAPDPANTWHIIRFLIGMTHSAASDDSKFGGATALINGCVLRQYDGGTSSFGTMTNWKANFDMIMDMFNLTYSDKAGGGPSASYGTNGRGSVYDATHSVPSISGPGGDYIELLVQDDLTVLADFEIKAQGHIEGQ